MKDVGRISSRERIDIKDVYGVRNTLQSITDEDVISCINDFVADKDGWLTLNIDSKIVKNIKGNLERYIILKNNLLNYVNSVERISYSIPPDIPLVEIPDELYPMGCGEPGNMTYEISLQNGNKCYYSFDSDSQLKDFELDLFGSDYPVKIDYSVSGMSVSWTNDSRDYQVTYNNNGKITDFYTSDDGHLNLSSKELESMVPYQVTYAIGIQDTMKKKNLFNDIYNN